MCRFICLGMWQVIREDNIFAGIKAFPEKLTVEIIGGFAEVCWLQDLRFFIW